MPILLVIGLFGVGVYLFRKPPEAAAPPPGVNDVPATQSSALVVVRVFLRLPDGPRTAENVDAILRDVMQVAGFLHATASRGVEDAHGGVATVQVDTLKAGAGAFIDALAKDPRVLSAELA